MTQQEFTERVGEIYANEFTHAEALYMALPNTDKDTFCALWKLEKETGLSIFAELACWVRAYNVEKGESSTFAECCRPMMGVFFALPFLTYLQIQPPAAAHFLKYTSHGIRLHKRLMFWLSAPFSPFLTPPASAHNS